MTAIGPAGPQDLPAVAELLAAIDAAEHGPPLVDLAFVRGEWARPRFDPTKDAWLAEEGGELVGFAQAYREEPQGSIDSFARVRADHRGRGLGTELLRRIEARAAQHVVASGRPSMALQQWIDQADRDPAALLERHGYRPVRTFFHMVVELGAGTSAPEPPAGTRIRGFEPGRDDRAVHAVMEEAFAGHWGLAPVSFEGWTEETLRAPGADPSSWLVATQDDEAVGALVGGQAFGMAWVDDLGVRPDRRGRGIGEALLRQAFARSRQRGFDRVGLNVDAGNETGATRLYERAGMREARRFVVYERTMSAPSGG